MGIAMAGRMRLATGAIALGALMAIAAPAPAQVVPGVPVCEALSPRRVVTTGSSALNLARGALDRAAALTTNREAAVPELMQARDACAEARGDRRNPNIEAYACFGRANLLIAKYSMSGKADNYQSAYCAFTTTRDLARRVEDRGREAGAEDGRAEALEGLNEQRPGSSLLTEAAAARQAAVAREPTVARRFAAARSLENGGRLSEANIAYGELVSAASSQDDRVRALIAQAGVQQKLNLPVEQVLQTWQRAAAMAPDSADVAFEMGKAYFKLGRFDDARGAFQRAAPVAIGAQRAETYYHLSVLGARDARTADQWSAVLQDAQQAGLGDARYQRQACLAYIARGGDPLRSDDSVICAAEPTAEGQLLRGMYSLRRAQYVGNITASATNRATWNRHLSDADAAFRRGSELARTPGSATTLDWPVLAEPAPIAEVLAYGEDVVDRVRARCEIDIRNTSAAGRAVFQRYQVFSC